MKKSSYILLSLLAAFVMMGCSSDDAFEAVQPKTTPTQDVKGVYELTATIDDGERTVLGEGNKVLLVNGQHVTSVQHQR
ncbi:MAG: hypothetical protein KBS94_00255 [Prevotella sp.]|nr:hypothetical protein [Candidatus Equicola faecalis]